MQLSIQKDRLMFGVVDKDNEVEVEMETTYSGSNPTVYLTQNEIKQVIAFLQQQLK